MESEVDTDVVIIGAATEKLSCGTGSTGLLIAQGLKAAGINFKIFERHDQHHVSREWSMSLHWGGEFLSRVLPQHLRDRLEEINTDPDHDFSHEKGFVTCNGETGEVLMVMPGAMPRRVSRRKLRTLLSEDIDVNYNKSLATVTVDVFDHASSSVAVTFSDNTSLKCHILIGADGSRSRTRHILIGDDALASQIPTPYTILNFPYTYPGHNVPELRAIHPVFKVSYHPKLNTLYMLSVLDTSKEKTTGEAMFQNLISWRGPPCVSDIRADPSLALKHLRELGKQYAPPFSIAAAEVADDALLFADQGMQWDPRPHFDVSAEGVSSWNHNSFDGRVTLAGDAGHAMLPHRGQGLNIALEDAARLVDALTAVFKDKKLSLQEAVTAYEKEMVRRGGQEVETSAKAAAASHDWNKLMENPVFKHGANKVNGA